MCQVPDAPDSRRGNTPRPEVHHIIPSQASLIKRTRDLSAIPMILETELSPDRVVAEKVDEIPKFHVSNLSDQLAVSPTMLLNHAEGKV